MKYWLNLHTDTFIRRKNGGGVVIVLKQARAKNYDDSAIVKSIVESSLDSL